MEIITSQEKEILRHTLGLDRGSSAYRNHFVAGPGHSDMPLLESLVAKGLMQQEPTPGFCPKTDLVYSVTSAGKRMARA